MASINQNTIEGKNIIYYDNIRKDEHFFVLLYTKKEEIIIKYLNIDKLDKLYKFSFPVHYLINELNNLDKNEIFEKIKNELDSNNFEFKEEENEIKLIIKLNGIKILCDMNAIEEFSIFLDNIKLRKIEEINVLTNENNKLKNSNINLNEENNKLKNKCNELEKENNSLKLENKELKKKIDEKKENNILDSQIDKFQNSFSENFYYKENKQEYFSYINYNELFWTSLQNRDVKSLDLSFTEKGNNLLEKLNNINFDSLEELKLFTNKITDINPLVKMNLKKLQILHLYNNFIKDISPLEKMDLIQLKQLFLQHNQISDINPLKNVKCIYLEYLYLDNNIISDISPLSKVKFFSLKVLCLHKNQIENINVFALVPFKNLEKLTLCFNNINDISVFNEVKFLKMKTLWLYNNIFKYNEKQGIINKLKEEILEFH